METSTDRVIVEPQERRVTRPRSRLLPLLAFFAVLAVIVVAAVIAGVLPRLDRERGLKAAVQLERAQRPVVNVIAARSPSSTVPVDLPGDLQAEVESPIFARADGYLIKRNVDIGDRVKTGQVMAEIETPELDQQLQQARATLSNSISSLAELQADLALAKANLKLSQQTEQRYVALEGKGAVSHQETDEKRADLDVKKAQADAATAKIVSTRDVIAANQANVHRLEQMKAFSKVTAPFDGVVTIRNVDVGTLINSGNAGTLKPMFSVAQIGTLRIFVNVPQAYLESIRVGQKAELRVQELPGQVFGATLTRISNEVDTGSRSMLAILEVPNPRGVLFPGMYAQVRFPGVRAASRTVLIPGDGLMLTSQGPRVAVVEAGNRIRFRDVKIGNDYGNELEIQSGIAPGELVVLHPTDAIRDGVEVDVHKSGNG